MEIHCWTFMFQFCIVLKHVAIVEATTIGTIRPDPKAVWPSLTNSAGTRRFSDTLVTRTIGSREAIFIRFNEDKFKQKNDFSESTAQAPDKMQFNNLLKPVSPSISVIEKSRHNDTWSNQVPEQLPKKARTIDSIENTSQSPYSEMKAMVSRNNLSKQKLRSFRPLESSIIRKQNILQRQSRSLNWYNQNNPAVGASYTFPRQQYNREYENSDRSRRLPVYYQNDGMQKNERTYRNLERHRNELGIEHPSEVLNKPRAQRSFITDDDDEEFREYLKSWKFQQRKSRELRSDKSGLPMSLAIAICIGSVLALIVVGGAIYGTVGYCKRRKKHVDDILSEVKEEDDEDDGDDEDEKQCLLDEDGNPSSEAIPPPAVKPAEDINSYSNNSTNSTIKGSNTQQIYTPPQADLRKTSSLPVSLYRENFMDAANIFPNNGNDFPKFSKEFENLPISKGHDHNVGREVYPAMPNELQKEMMKPCGEGEGAITILPVTKCDGNSGMFIPSLEGDGIVHKEPANTPPMAECSYNATITEGSGPKLSKSPDQVKNLYGAGEDTIMPPFEKNVNSSCSSTADEDENPKAFSNHQLSINPRVRSPRETIFPPAVNVDGNNPPVRNPIGCPANPSDTASNWTRPWKVTEDDRYRYRIGSKRGLHKFSPDIP